MHRSESATTAKSRVVFAIRIITTSGVALMVRVCSRCWHPEDSNEAEYAG
jgi:hypothetical protein